MLRLPKHDVLFGPSATGAAARYLVYFRPLFWAFR